MFTHNRVLALLLAFTMMVSGLPVTAFAQTDSDTPPIVTEEASDFESIPEEVSETQIPAPAENNAAPEDAPVTVLSVEPVEAPDAVSSAAEMPEQKNAGVASGTCGDNLTWTLDEEGTLSISGTGPMYNWYAAGENVAPWMSYANDIKAIEIGDQVTTIGDHAFEWVGTSITSISIPDEVTAIGDYAFYAFQKITEITLPSKLQTIGAYAFANCTRLKTIEFPESITNIGANAFRGSGLKEIYLFTHPVVGANAFYGLTATVYYSASSNWTDAERQSIGGMLTWSAEKDPYSTIIMRGTCGENATFALDKEYTLTISGTGDMDYTTDWGKLNAYKASVKKVIIEPGVTSVYGLSNYGFSEISIPDTVAKIERDAFSGCTNLTSVTIPDSITEIDLRIFYECTGLTEVILPVGVTKIGDYAFYGCTSLTDIVLPETVTEIAEGAFEKSGLTEITIPKNVNSIGANAFSSCKGLKEIWFEGHPDQIGDYAFLYDSAVIRYNEDSGWTLEERQNLTPNTSPTEAFVWVPMDTPEIVAFGSNDIGTAWALDVEHTLILSGAGTVSGYELKNLKDEVQHVVIQEGITGIYQLTFKDFSNLTSVILPDSLTTIGYSAFDGCSVLTSITIPDGVTDILQVAFSGCNNLREIHFLGHPAVINETAFSGVDATAYYSCTDASWTAADLQNYGGTLTWEKDHNVVTDPAVEPTSTETGLTEGSHCSACGEILVAQEIIPATGGIIASGTCGDNLTWTLDNEGTLTISGTGDMFPEIYRSEYQQDAYRSDIRKLVIEPGVTSISEAAFTDCKNLAEISIPDTVTAIGRYAFQSCTSLTEASIPNSATTVGDGVFNSCSNLTEVTVPGEICFDTGFYWCPALRTVRIQEGSKAIAKNFLYRREIGIKIETVIIPDSVTAIGDYAFYDCSSLKNIAVPSGVTSIGRSAFYDCESLTEMVLPDSVTSIGTSAFEGCTNLTSVVVPSSVTSIDQRTFYNCSSLAEATLPGHVDYTWHNLYGCNALKTVTIAEGTTEIAHRAFQGNTVIEKFILPDSVATIGRNAFDGCTSLRAVNIPDGVTSLGWGAFSNCPGLTAVTVPGSVTEFGPYAFWNCTGLTSAVIAPGVTVIGDNAFRDCVILKSVSIPDSVTEIQWAAFWGCSSLQDVKIPAGVTALGMQVFVNCSSLTEVTIPAGVKRLQMGTFKDCSSLTKITFQGDAPQIDSDAFENVTATAYYPDGNSTWTEYVKKDYGGTVTWMPANTVLPVTPAKPYKIANVVSGVHVYWNAVAGADKYGLWRSENGINGTYKWVANPTVPHFTDTKVESGKTYYYKVTAMNLFLEQTTDKSPAIGITFVSTPDITSRSNNAAGVFLGWNAIEGATGYAIYRKSYSGTDAWIRVGTISGNTTLTWTDESVKNNNGEAYKYTVRALAGSNMATLSGCRNEGRTMVRLSSQVLKSMEKAGATSAKATWTTSSRVTGYEVRFMDGDTVFKTFTVGNYKTGVKTFTGLTAGKTYAVQVRTYKKVDGVGSFYSDWSAPKTVSLK